VALDLALEAMTDQIAEVTMDLLQEVMEKDLLLVVMGDQALAQDLEATLDLTHLEQTVVLVKHLLGMVRAMVAQVAQAAMVAMVAQVAQAAPMADAELTDFEFTR